MAADEERRMTRAARLRPQWLRLASATVALLALVSVAAGIPSRYAQLATVSPAANTIAGQLLPDDAQRLAQSGVLPQTYALYFTAAETLSALVSLAVAGLIVWSGSAHWVALLVSLNLVSSAASLPLVPALGTAYPQWAWLALAWRSLFAGSLILLFYQFPDGRFVPRWTRWLAGAWLAYVSLLLFLPGWEIPASFGRGLLAEDAVPTVSAAVFLVAGVLAQMWRYRRVSSAVERKRTRWVVFGFGLFLAGFLAGVGTLTYVTAAPTGLSLALARLAGPTFILVGSQALAVSIALAVLRHHLWDIDVILRRTLIYSVLTGVLALAYLGSVVLLQTAFRWLTGQAQPQFVTVLSTLAIAALFGPVRARVQLGIDRRFYRRKYDAARTLASFAANARDETNLERLSAQLVGVVEETMEPVSVRLWLRGNNS
jgi:hypothetical protein